MSYQQLNYLGASFSVRWNYILPFLAVLILGVPRFTFSEEPNALEHNLNEAIAQIQAAKNCETTSRAALDQSEIALKHAQELNNAVAEAVTTAKTALSKTQAGNLGGNVKSRDKIVSGKRIYFKRKESEPAPTIQAAWIEEAVGNHVKIDVRNAVILGSLNLKYASIEKEFSLINCKFEKSADLSYTTFKRNVDLTGTIFNCGAQFESATLACNTFLVGTRFLSGKANFYDLHACGAFVAKNLWIRKKVEVNFERAHFDKNAFFRQSAFRSGASFLGAYFGGQAEFSGAKFTGEGKVIFSKVEIVGDAYFKGEPEKKLAGTRFEGEVDFIAAHIGGQVCFQGAVFKKNVNFNGAKIDQRVFFRGEPEKKLAGTRFEGKVGFIAAYIGGTADFSGVVFLKNVSFNGVEIVGDAFFGGKPKKNLHGTVFKDEANFSNSRFRNVVDFQGAIFRREANFYATHCDTLARFERTVFKGRVILRETLFRVADFSDTRFQGRVDLVGCTYERVQGDWQPLIDHAEYKPKKHDKYDRQPYNQLEKALRAAGKDNEANNVYLRRQNMERKLKWQQGHLFGWLFSALYWLLNYGVFPYYFLIPVSVLMLYLGTNTFSEREAVSLKSNKEKTGLPVTTKWSSRDAFILSITQFLPLEVPMGSQYVPSDMSVDVKIWLWWPRPLCLRMPASIFATVLRLAGWILVPLWVAALTGLLRVKP